MGVDALAACWFSLRRLTPLYDGCTTAELCVVLRWLREATKAQREATPAAADKTADPRSAPSDHPGP